MIAVPVHAAPEGWFVVKVKVKQDRINVNTTEQRDDLLYIDDIPSVDDETRAKLTSNASTAKLCKLSVWAMKPTSIPDSSQCHLA